MPRTHIFSRQFPDSHRRAGEATYFVELILNSLGIDFKSRQYLKWLYTNNPAVSKKFLRDFQEELGLGLPNKRIKVHTIRSHKKPFKVGEVFTPKCWAGQPYRKTENGYWQINFAPDIKIVKRWNFNIQKPSFLIDGIATTQPQDIMLANNDGLILIDMLSWFKYPTPFDGHILCWSENVNYATIKSE